MAADPAFEAAIDVTAANGQNVATLLSRTQRAFDIGDDALIEQSEAALNQALEGAALPVSGAPAMASLLFSKTTELVELEAERIRLNGRIAGSERLCAALAKTAISSLPTGGFSAWHKSLPNEERRLVDRAVSALSTENRSSQPPKQ